MKYFLLVFFLLSSNCYSQELPMDLFDRTTNKETAYAVPNKLKVDVKPPAPKKPEVKLDFKPKIPSKAITVRDDPKTIPNAPVFLNPPLTPYPPYRFVEPQTIRYPQISPVTPIRRR